MTLRVRAASIAPDLRFGVAGGLADPAGDVLAGGVSIRTEGCLPLSPLIPRYLRYAHREAVLVTDGVGSLGELESCLSDCIHALADSGGWGDLGAAVIALDAVDRCFRAALSRCFGNWRPWSWPICSRSLASSALAHMTARSSTG